MHRGSFGEGSYNEGILFLCGCSCLQFHGTGFYFNVAGQGKPLRAEALGKEEGETVSRLVTPRKYLHFCPVYARLLQGDRYGNVKQRTFNLQELE